MSENINIQAVQRLKSNNKHSSKISWYRKNVIEMVAAIDERLKELDINIPRYWQEYKVRRAEIMKFEDYGEALVDEYEQLIKTRYDLLKSGKAVYAIFEGVGLAPKTQIVACWYSKNRLDPVWNYRKSQLIRNIYRTYLKDSNIHNQFHPCHLVLTVPHKDGLFNGKRFYVQEIMKAYNLMRKTEAWKKFIYGGEYGVEVKKGKDGNGLHIHIHSLVFHHPKYSVNEVRAAISTEWKAITGATFTHYETLYFFKKNETGRYITEERNGKEVRKKHYIDRLDRPTDEAERLNEYLFGVMECIKYHFKNDSIQDKDGNYDVDLMADILNNTKGVRLYSRFGALYKVKELNFNNLEKPHEDQEDSEVEEEIMATTDNVAINMINPHTCKPAKAEDYRFVIGKPEWLKHHPKSSITPFEPEIYTPKMFYDVHPGFLIKEILVKLFKNRLEDILTDESISRMIQSKRTPEATQGQQRRLRHTRYEKV